MEVTVHSGPSTPQQAEDCAVIYSAAFAASGERCWSAQEFADLLDRETTLLLRTAKAVLLAEIVLDEAEILTFAVAPDKQRQGAGRSLLERLLKECTRRKVRRCILEVAENNAAAINLYTSCDFTVIAIRESYFRRESGLVSALVMEKRFSAD